MVYHGTSWFIPNPCSLFGGYSALLIILGPGQTCMKWYTAKSAGYLWIVIAKPWTPSPVSMSFLQFPGRCFSSLGTLVMQSLPCGITLNQPLSPVHSHQQCFQFSIAHTDVMTKQRRCIGTFTKYGPWIGKQQDVAIEPHPDKNNRAVVKTIKCHYVLFTSSWLGPWCWFHISIIFYFILSMFLRDFPCYIPLWQLPQGIKWWSLILFFFTTAQLCTCVATGTAACKGSQRYPRPVSCQSSRPRLGSIFHCTTLLVTSKSGCDGDKAARLFVPNTKNQAAKFGPKWIVAKIVKNRGLVHHAIACA